MRRIRSLFVLSALAALGCSRSTNVTAEDRDTGGSANVDAITVHCVEHDELLHGALQAPVLASHPPPVHGGSEV